MTVALKFCIVVLVWLAAVQADVSHLGSRRYKGQRLRLLRLESEPTPYPAAGYRPNREFNLPHNQPPLFPLDNQHGNRPFGSSSLNNLGEAQRPQLTYGSPQQEPRFRPQKFNGLDEPQEQVFVVKYHQRQQPAQAGINNFARPQQSQNNDFNNFAEDQQRQQPAQTGFNNFDRPQQSHNNDFNNFAEDQQRDLEEQTANANQQPQNGFNNLAQPQQPEILYGAPNSQEQEVQSSRLRQHLVARLKQAQRFEKIQQQQQKQAESQRYRQSKPQLQIQTQQQPQFLNAPQNLYSVPSQQLQLQAESQTNHFIAAKPARLTDNREETEIDTDAKTAETEDIETTTKAEGKKTVTQTVPAAGVTPVVANTGVVGYYPAAAVGFVQPLNAAAYIAAANYQTVQPFPAAYTVGSPYLPQQYAFAAAPAAQLKAW